MVGAPDSFALLAVPFFILAGQIMNTGGVTDRIFRFAARPGVTGASSTIGPIIPPSIPFVIFGAVGNVSAAGLFIGGLLPGVLMALALAAMVFLVARRRGYPVRPRATAAALWAAFRRAGLAPCMPVILIGVLNLMIGLLTPPVGFGLYILAAISGRDLGYVVRAVLPWLVPLLVALLLITLFPELVLFLPRLTGFA